MIPWLMAVSTPIRMKIMKPNGHICVSLKFGHIFNLFIAIFVALRVDILNQILSRHSNYAIYVSQKQNSSEMTFVNDE
jgi:hypothetical protein